MIRIEIETDNAAFADEPATELARILRAAAARIERDGDSDFPLYDLNGNRCGFVRGLGDD